MKRLFSATLLLAVLILPSLTGATNHQINISGFAFTPAKTKVNYGDTVTWTNMDAFAHTSTSKPGSPKTWNSGTLTTSATYSIVINPADGRGPFPYFCGFHPTMEDTIFVATSHQVSIIDFDYTPKGLIINPGDTVVWTNNGTMQHSSTSDLTSPKAWDSGLLPVSSSFNVTFTALDGLGPFPYHCTPHSFMVDTVRINPLFCCKGTTGNVNKSVSENPDLSDLSLLIAYLTTTPRPTLPCLTEANVNLSGNVDLSDLSLLIAYLTTTPRPTLPNCPV